MIGKEIGKDMGGVLNNEDGFCPENLNTLWKYWNDFRDVRTIFGLKGIITFLNDLF